MGAQFALVPRQNAGLRWRLIMKHDFRPLLSFSVALAGALTLVGCAATGANSPSARPVLYPNATLNRVGDAAARAEVDACMARAQAAGLTPHDQNNATGQRAAQGAAVGGVAAAVGALVTGRNLDGILGTGLAGAAVGGSAGAVSGAMQNRPSGIYRQYVQRCVGDKGFEVIGWN